MNLLQDKIDEFKKQWGAVGNEFYKWVLENASEIYPTEFKIASKIQIPPPYNPDDYETMQFSPWEEFQDFVEGKCTNFEYVEGGYRMYYCTDDGEWYKYCRPIPEPKRWFNMSDHGEVWPAAEFEGGAVRFDECDTWYRLDCILEVTDLGGPDYKPEPPKEGEFIYKSGEGIKLMMGEAPIWTHAELVEFHKKNPHAVWSINGNDFISMNRWIATNFADCKYSLDLGLSFHEPRGEV